MTEDKTPPTGTRLDRAPAEIPRPLPTLPGVYNLVAGVAGQLGGLRTDVDTLLLRTESIEKLLAAAEERALMAPSAPPGSTPSSDVLFIPKLPSPGSLSPPAPAPAPRPSMAAKAAQSTGKAGRLLLIGSGALAIVGQLLAMANKPEYGPIVVAIEYLRRFIAGQGGAP